jgi:hypothetical protein
VRRPAIIWLLAGVMLLVLALWIARHTEWVDTNVPMPLKGEAAVNPFYAAQRFAEALGARAVRDRVFTTPPAASVIVLSAWHWNLSRTRREALEHWVESGGRLVVDWDVTGGREEFERWSGVVRRDRRLDEQPSGSADSEQDEDCRDFQEEQPGAATEGDTAHYSMCDFAPASFLATDRNIMWAVRDANGLQAVRVGVGRGSVTVIDASPFRYRNLSEADHARLFVAATELRRDDEVHFLSEENHPSLIALIWVHGWPVVALALVGIALALWRGAIRFGPLAAPPPVARRSLAEQIRGTGHFTLRHGGAESLHAACVDALDDAARTRVPGYTNLTAAGRADALARLTGFDATALAAAIDHPFMRRGHQLRSTIALLEDARRRTLATCWLS